MVDTAVRSSTELAKKVLFEKYELGRLLGRGASAKVYHARDLRSGLSVAIKCIPKLLISKGELSPVTIKREIAIMRRLRHPHIVRLLEVLATRSKIYFVLELAKGGELFDLVSAAGRLSEDQSRRFFKQLVSAVGYCHSRGVFHRDLKPENLLLDDSGDLKVSDFGLSAVRSDGEEPDHLLRTICGTPAYVAPEILAKKAYDGAAADVWSCGVVLFVLVTGYLPFNDRNLMAMYRKIYRGVYRLPRWTSPELRRLIMRLLDTNPETRITVEGILRDPWVRIGGEIRFRGEDAATKFESGRELNAFDIISFSSGLDLTVLLEPESDRERFVWAGSEEGARARVEAVGREEGAVVRRRDDEMEVEGRGGDRLSTVGFHRLTGGLVVVEVETRGVGEDDRWGRDFWRERLRPISDMTASSCN